MTSTTTRPARGTPDPTPGSPGRALTARVTLGRVFAPVPSEFLLIASTSLLLTGFGLVMVLSATSAIGTANGDQPYEALLKQAIFAAIGVPLMFVMSRFPIAFWKRMAWPALIVATLGQLLVFTPLGHANDGNRNWITIAGMQAQPSEFLKLALALWLGYVLYRKRTLLGLWRHVFIPVVPVSVLAMATVLAGGDLGTVMILALIVIAALFFSGVKLRIFIIPLLLGAIGIVGYAVTSANRMKRIMSFLDPVCTDYYNACYQPLHGIWGLASGGFFGLGLGNSKQKYDWLPAAANDYIFAIVGEELGLIGCCVVLVLLALFAVGAFHIIRKTDDTFVRIVSGAIAIWIVGEALLNIGVVLRLFPVLGVPLPFLSQGGTSLLSTLLACGVLLSFARTLPARAPAARADARATGAGASAKAGRRVR